MRMGPANVARPEIASVTRSASGTSSIDVSDGWNESSARDRREDQADRLSAAFANGRLGACAEAIQQEGLAREAPDEPTDRRALAFAMLARSGPRRGPTPTDSTDPARPGWAGGTLANLVARRGRPGHDAG
jgi:hypothetical protein